MHGDTRFFCRKPKAAERLLKAGPALQSPIFALCMIHKSTVQKFRATYPIGPILVPDPIFSYPSCVKYACMISSLQWVELPCRVNVNAVVPIPNIQQTMNTIAMATAYTEKSVHAMARMGGR